MSKLNFMKRFEGLLLWYEGKLTFSLANPELKVIMKRMYSRRMCFNLIVHLYAIHEDPGYCFIILSRIFHSPLRHKLIFLCLSGLNNVIFLVMGHGMFSCIEISKSLKKMILDT